MRFLHAADVHIDSPLRGLSRYEGAPADRLRSATRQAFANLVELALTEQVQFVVIAGDLFDGQWPDMQTGLWTASQFRRLRDADIPVFLLRGNHDAASVIEHELTWPENVFLFSDTQPQTWLREDLGVALHGQGFAERETREDLVEQFPEPVAGLFNIGVLHTSLAGSSDHDVYAPTHADVLASKRYQYWALGHVHQRQVVREHPHIVFPGNTQGRHIRETGAKGCYLVDVEQHEVQGLRFVATDTLRWARVEVELARDDQVPEALEKVREGLQSCRAGAEGRFSAVRLVVHGACAAHDEIVDPGKRIDLIQRIRYEASQLDEDVWLEKIVFQTQPTVDLETLRQSIGPLGDLLREIGELRESPESCQSLVELFDSLERKAATELHDANINLRDPAAIQGWLRDAEQLLATLEAAK